MTKEKPRRYGILSHRCFHVEISKGAGKGSSEPLE